MPGEDVIGEWDEITEYKQYNGSSADVPSNYMSGFFSEAVGNHLFAKVWEIYKRFEHDKKVPEDKQLSPDYETGEWKMTL